MTTKLIPTRALVGGGMFLLALLLYIDRVCISVAKEPIAGSLDLNDKQMGWVLSVFALGYALCQVPAGSMSDRYGPRKVLASIVSFWSLLTAFTGAAFSYGSLLIIRLLFGAGEAGAFPGMSRAVFSWFPLRERGLVLGLNFSGSRLGAAFALPLVAWLIESYGWRMSFYILGGVGVVWAILWWLAFRDRPEEHQAVSEKEKEYILANRQQSDDKEQLASIPIGQLLQSSNMLSAIGQYFASNFTFFFALSWLFPFLKEQYNLEAVEAGWASVAPFIFGALGNWLGGIWMDSLFQNSTWRRSRILPAITGFGMAALGMMGSVYADNLWLAVAFLSIAIMGADMTLPTSWALCVDIGKEQSGRVSGLMNMAGNVGAFLTALAFPYLKDWTGSMDVFFYTAAGLNLLAIWLWTRVEPAKGLES